MIERWKESRVPKTDCVSVTAARRFGAVARRDVQAFAMCLSAGLQQRVHGCGLQFDRGIADSCRSNAGRLLKFQNLFFAGKDTRRWRQNILRADEHRAVVMQYAPCDDITFRANGGEICAALC